MNTDVIIIAAVSAVAVLLACAIGVFFWLRARSRRRFSGEQLRLSYPELDQELEVIWQCLNPASGL
jgi:hypothetical protein